MKLAVAVLALVCACAVAGCKRCKLWIHQVVPVRHHQGATWLEAWRDLSIFTRRAILVFLAGAVVVGLCAPAPKVSRSCQDIPNLQLSNIETGAKQKEPRS